MANLAQAFLEVSAACKNVTHAAGLLQFTPHSQFDLIWAELLPRIEALIDAKLAAVQAQNLLLKAPSEDSHVRTIPATPTRILSPGSI